VEHFESSRLPFVPLPAPHRVSVHPCGALGDTYLRCRSGLIRIRVAVQPTCETSRFCLSFTTTSSSFSSSSSPHARLCLRNTVRGPTAYGEMRDASPLPVTTTVFSFLPLSPPLPRLTSHVTGVRRTSCHTARRTRSPHSLLSLVHGDVARTHRAQPRVCTKSMCTRALARPGRAFTCPPALPVRSSVRPSVRLSLRRHRRRRRASSRLRLAVLSRTPAACTIHRIAIAHTRGMRLRHMFQRTSSTSGTHARTHARFPRERMPEFRTSTRE